MTSNVALVTGASRGIGKAIAIALAGIGFDVAVSARTLVDGSARLDDGETLLPGGLDTTVAEIEATGQSGLAVEMDLLDRTSVLACADRVLEHFGRVDVLVNNAIYQGEGAMVPIGELGEEHLLPLFEGNVHAQIALISRLLPAFVAQGGATVVNMTSMSARIDPPAKIGAGGWGAGYAMTKAALERVAPILTVEHGDDGIVAFSVDPGLVTTERQLAKGTATNYSSHFPAATPAVIGAAVAWLVTDPEARNEYGGQVVFAQKEVRKRGLIPDSPPSSTAG
jgi:NAD(P)-dependent dehydrogenase (short-subunit alcohol dehydrogenase family)